MPAEFPDDDYDLIFSYTRAQALDDGVSVACPADLLKEAGIKYHTALTAELWNSTIVPDEASRAAGQSETGRLWDVLMVFRTAARRTDGSLLLFKVRFLFGGTEHRDVGIKSVCGPGDDAEPVITLMLPGED